MGLRVRCSPPEIETTMLMRGTEQCRRGAALPLIDRVQYRRRTDDIRCLLFYTRTVSCGVHVCATRVKYEPAARFETCYAEQRNTTGPFPTPACCTTERMLKRHVTFAKNLSTRLPQRCRPGSASMPTAIFCTWAGGYHHARVLPT